MQPFRSAQEISKLAEIESIYASAPMGLCVLDTELRVVRVNQRFAEANGLPIEAFIGKMPAEVIPDLGKAEAILREVLETGEPRFNIEISLTAPARPGEIQHWKENLVPIKDSAGKVIGISVSAEEITERKKAEAELRESEERYRSLYDNNHAVMLLIDPADGQIMDGNKAALRYYGYTLDELTRLHITDINILSPEQVHIEMQMAKSMKRRHFFFKHQLADGRIRDVEVFSGPISVNGSKMLYSIIHDVTERRRAEEALRESEARIRSIYQGAPIGIGVSNNRVITEVNDRVCEICGYSREELIGKDAKMVYLSDEAYRHVGAEKKSQIAERGIGSMETRLKRKDGRVIDVLVSSTPLDQNDPSGSMAFTVMDISERKRMESALERSIARFDALFNQMTEGLIIFDTEGNLLDINPAALAMHEIDKGSCVGKNLSDLVDDFELHDLDGVFLPIEKWPIGRVLAGEKFERYEVMIRNRSTGKTWIGSYGGTTVNGPDEKPLISIVTLRDITGQKQAEENIQKLARFPEENPNPVWRVNDQGNLLYSNRAGDEVLNLWGIQAGWALPSQLVRTAQMVLEKGIHLDEDVVCGQKIFQFCFAPVTESRYVNVYGRDISVQKQAEAELLQLNETLEQQVAERTELAETRAKLLQSLAVELVEAEERERQRVAGWLHDDLQQLLAAARFKVQAASKDMPHTALFEKVDRLLKESIEKSRHMSYRIGPPVLHQFGLAPALEWMVRRMDEQFGLKINLEMKTDLQDVFSSQKIFLFRAVQELLFNVYKHSGAKTASIVLTGDDDDKLTLSVKDHGQGFDTQILKTAVKKAGLGLLSLKERTHALGGKLEIKSSPGKGSHFLLTIPIKPSENAESKTSDLNEKTHFAEPDVISDIDADLSIRVLFCDDHQVMRQGLISLVAGQPEIQVVGEAANGEQALELARQIRPDVIMMDISMPKMDGIETTRRIKAEIPGIRVIGLSMFDDETTAQEMQQAGADGFVSKSGSSEELLNAIYKIGGRQIDVSGS